MADGFTLDYSKFETAAARLSAVSWGDLQALMRSQAKGFVDEVFKITPPASGGKSTGRTALQMAEKRIDRDLRGVFKPVQIKGVRAITHLFGDTSPDVGRRPPYLVRTKELHPDVEAVYRQRKGRQAGTGRKALSRGRRAAYYVDEAKLVALAKKLHGFVGWLAAGFNAAARELKARIPAYASRHKAPGTIRVEVSDSRIRITITNEVKYAAGVPGLQRRIQAALDKQAGKMERQIPHILKRAAESSGFKAAA